MSYYNKKKSLAVIAAASFMVSNVAMADAPAGYYNAVDTTNATTLKATLHAIIDDHQRFPYTSSSTDTWDILEAADQDPDNPNNVIDIYRNASYPKAGGGNTNYNREHSWPKSYGFPKDGSSNSAYTDAHHLFIADSSYNSSRSNKPYADCTSGCTEKVTLVNNGRGGSSAESNWTAGSFSSGSWQTWSGRKGDVARALMYMAVRYEGGTHGVTGHAEPDLILTDDRTLIEQSNQGANISVAYMGLKSVLLQWHKDDPVDAFEMRHNDVVYSYQGNRNPFVDHPEYVSCVFEAQCSGLGGGTGGDTTAPTTPSGLTAMGGNASVNLTWNANSESDLAGYNVYRSDSSNGTYIKVNNGLVNTSMFDDSNLSAATTYFYKVTAVDTSSNESAQSSVVFATTDEGTSAPTGIAWINEFHYDNSSSDINEFVEIAGSEGTDLTGWQVVAYNGSNGESYKTVTLNGTLSNQSNGFGFYNVAFTGMQNGGPDGLALVNASGEVVQFISYEGTMTAANGPAAGQTSTDIGVSETTSTPVGYSLQLTGSGSQYSDFTWTGPQTDNPGQANTGQSFTGAAPVNQAPVASFTANCTNLTCNFNANASSDTDGSIVAYDWSFGDGKTSTGPAVTNNYANAGDYTVTLTVTDNQGATDVVSQNVSVTAPAVLPWINEFHYDNSGSDRNEFVEIAGTAGTDLSGWTIEAVNGSNGEVYKTINLSGSIDNEQSGYGALGFNAKGLQNGPDGLVLVNDQGEVVQFISYEGTISATNGAAAGLSSTNVGVKETSSTGRSQSLQLKGTGSVGDDFNWSNPTSASKGSLNSGQSIN